MRALVRDGRDVALVAMDAPVPGPDDVVVRIAFAGVCRTDIWAADGRIPTAKRVVLGHEASGTVLSKGDAVTRVSPGDRVTFEPFVHEDGMRKMLGIDRDGVFADCVRVPATIVHRLPSSLSLRAGAYVEPIAASLAVARAPLPPPTSDPRGLVVGRGRIAILTARILSALGYRDVDVRAAHDEIEREAYAFAVETIATTETVRAAVGAVVRGGVIVLKSRDRSAVGLSIGDVVAKELVLAGVEHGSFESALDMIHRGAIDPTDLVGDVMPLEEWPAAFSRARATEATKVLFRMDLEAS
jgi:L-iditol 2-dehydrogenase